MKPGTKVWVYYCPDLETFASQDTMGEDDYQEAMTSFVIKRGTVVDPTNVLFEMEGDYEWGLCIAMDDEQEEQPKARTFRKSDNPNVWEEGPYYGGYCATAVVIEIKEAVCE